MTHRNRDTARVRRITLVPAPGSPPAALVAAWLYAELDDPELRVVVDTDLVSFSSDANEADALRALVERSLRDPRFGGWRAIGD